jgi:iron(III) transport system ATP-binding protein
MATAVSAEPPEDSSGPDGEAAAGAASVEIDSVLLAFDGDPVLRGLSLEVRPGEVMALLGPSGCGKTTLLRVVAGLEEPEAGEVRMSGRLLTSPGKVVAPEKRDVAMVFQDWALFPHMTVAENVGFGLPRGQRRSSPLIARTLDLVGLGGLGERMPESLSGGQQQRVALGRALAQRPAVLLLDEPFSNLDPTLRGRVRSDVKEVLREVGVTTVLVTHDRDEAFVLGDRVAVMRDGAISQVDTPEALYLRPRDEWVADFVGELNVVDGMARGTRVDTALGELDPANPCEGRVRVGVRPEQLRLEPDSGVEAPMGVVEQVEYHGPRTGYRVRCSSGVLRAELSGPPRLSVGDAVRLAIDGPVLCWPQ